MSTENLLGLRWPILLDGAMGTELAAAGLEPGGENNLSHPDRVLGVHRAYAAAGCGVLITNTLTMNRIYIETHGGAVDVGDVNRAGARLAREAAGEDRRVLGDVGSTGQLLEPYGDCPEPRAVEAFREQAERLAEGGVDGFIVETMLDLREALAALRGCRAAADLPVIVSLSFQTAGRGGRTMMGDGARDAAKAAAEAGAFAVGANCGDLDPFQTAEIIGAMKEGAAIPLIAQPNAGRPTLAGGRTVFDMTPREFARGIKECLRAGASLVGGCCGTTPEHLREARRIVDEFQREGEALRDGGGPGGPGRTGGSGRLPCSSHRQFADKYGSYASRLDRFSQ